MAPRRKFDFKFKEKVLQFAEENSGEKAARHFNIDSKRIRYWRKQKAQLLLADKSRARLTGAGRKKVSLQLERKLSDWIYSMRDQHSRVSRNMIKNKALEIYPSVSDGGKMFVASTGWLQRFLQRNDLSLRRRTPMAQTDPDLLTQKLVSFVDFVGKTVRSKGVSERDIIAMDETAVWFDPVSPTPETRGAKSPGPEESHLTVVLAARADGTKLKPYIVFRGAAGEAKPPQQRSSGAVVASSVNGWMNDALTADWLQSVVGKVSVTPRLLVWDSYRCHFGAATKAELKRGYNITTAEIPGGCAKYIQAPDVMWNRPFKQSLQDAYSLWVAGGADKEHTAGGSLKAPAHRLLVDWVVAAWDKLDTDLIRESFKVCGLSVKPDGSEDDLILCFREGQPCAAGRGALSQARQRSQENRCEAVQGEEDEEELFNNELVVFDDDEEEGDNGEDEEEEEDGDHMSLHCFIHQALPSKDKKQIIIKEEQQDWSPSLDQEDPEPPHIKEEQEEVWTSQEGEQLQGLEEADITKFPFTPVPVKSEDDEEKPQSSQLHQRHTEKMETGAYVEDYGGPEPARNSDPDRHLQPDTDDKAEDSSEPETEVSDGDWKETREPQSGLKTRRNKEIPVSDVRCKTGEKPFSCSECGKIFDGKGSLKRHLKIHTGEKPFSCSVCGKRFTHRANMTQHMAVHTGEKRYSCRVCDKRFTWSTQVKTHRCVDESSQLNEVKSFRCSECSKTFGRNTNLKAHMRIHTGEKPFSCSVCDKRFTWHHQLQTHKCVGRQLSQLHQNQTEENREAEPPACSSTGQMKTGADGEDCGGPEPARNSDPDRHLQPDTDDKTEDSSETEVSDGWNEAREPQSGLNSLKHNEVSVSDINCNTAEKPFSCSLCGKRFGHKDYLKTHMRIHTGEKPFNCSFCGERFSRRTTLISHSSVHTGEKPFSCSVCKKRFSYRGSVWSHMRIHAWQKRFNSNISDTKLTNTHSNIHRGSEPAKSINSESRLQADTDNKTEDCHKVPVTDMRCKTAEKPFSCSECGKLFGRKTHLKSHMRIHTGEKLFGCSVCSKRFVHRTNLTQHMAVHTGEKRYSCSVCEKRFIWYCQLKNHKCVGRQSSQFHQSQTEENREAEPPASSSTEQMEARDDGEDCGGPEPARNSDPDRHLQPDTDDRTEDSSEFKVEISDDDWKETSEPQSGLNTLINNKVITCNNGEKSISCSECGKIFGHNGNLSRHMRTHTGEKPFSCAVCGRGFADKATLTKHMRTHTGEKPFSCLICGKRFTHRVSLKQHMAQHEREKQLGCVGESSQPIEVETFSCSECEKTFGRKDTLQEHVRTHTGEKPFSCSECSKTFGRKSNLKAHMRIHTGEKRFSCSVCHQRFTWHHQLKNHQCVVHSANCGGSKPARNRVLMPRPSSDELVLFVYL